MMRVLFFTVLLALAAPSLSACDCAAAPPVSTESVRPFDFIFSGKVVAVSGCNGTANVKFTVDELFRGKSYASTELEFDCSSDCQMSFSPDEEWLIYAKYTGYGKAKVEFCSYSRKKFAAEKDDYNSLSHGMDFVAEKKWLETNLGVQKLNEPVIADQQHHENLKPQGMSAIWMILIGFGVLGLFYFLVKKLLR